MFACLRALTAGALQAGSVLSPLLAFCTPLALELDEDAEVFFYIDPDSKERNKEFYLDPELRTSRELLKCISEAVKRFNKNNPTVAQRPAVVSSLPKMGKSTTTSKFLPALLRTYGCHEHVLPEAGMPTPPLEPGIEWCLWSLNGLGFIRTLGTDGVLKSLLTALQRSANAMGFTAAASLPSSGDAEGDVLLLLCTLPKDRLHFVVVDEAQSFFLLELHKDEGQPKLDLLQVREMRRIFTALVMKTPLHVLWVFTGSTSNILISNLAEGPTNGTSLLAHCHFIHLSATVTDDQLCAAWALLQAADKSLPATLLDVTPQHHAMLSFLCDEWGAPGRPTTVVDFYSCVLEQKLLPEVLVDIRVVLETMEESKTYFGDCDGVQQLAKLQKLLDPSQGLKRGSLHKYFEVSMRPYLRPVPTEDGAPSDDMVYVDCPIYQLLLLAVTTVDGKLVRSLMGGDVPVSSVYQELASLRKFGELVNLVKGKKYVGCEHVRDLLEDMAKVLGEGINKQPWYLAVLTHPNSAAKVKADTAVASLDGFEAMQWGIVQARHCLSHHIGSECSFLDVCRTPLLVPFGPKMEEARGMYLQGVTATVKAKIKPAKSKVPPVIKSMLSPSVCGIRSRCQVAGARRSRNALMRRGC